MNNDSVTLEPSFLRAVIMITGFKGSDMHRCQAALLLIGLERDTFTAADLPGECANGSRHLAGAATGALIAQGLLSVVGRVKSPHASAKGRKLDLLRIAEGKRSTVRTWLSRHGYESTPEAQLSLAM